MNRLDLKWHGRNTTVMITNEKNDAGSEENIQKATEIAAIGQELLPNTIFGLEPPHYYAALRRVLYVTRGTGALVAGRNVIPLWPGLLVFAVSEQVQTIIPNHTLEIREAFTADEEYPNLAGRMAIDPPTGLPAELRKIIGYYPKKIRRKMAQTYAQRVLNTKHQCGSGDMSKIGKISKINLPLRELCARLAIEL